MIEQFVRLEGGNGGMFIGLLYVLDPRGGTGPTCSSAISTTSFLVSLRGV